MTRAESTMSFCLIPVYQCFELKVSDDIRDDKCPSNRSLYQFAYCVNHIMAVLIKILITGKANYYIFFKDGIRLLLYIKMHNRKHVTDCMKRALAKIQKGTTA